MAIKTAMNLIFAGVGGQGILLASDLVCDVALASGYDTKKSEVHGMAQRGGSVVSQVRFAEQVYSPLISLASADLIVSFEKLEALRYLDLLKPNGLMVVNDHQIIPQTVQMGEVEYPKDILPLCGLRTQRVILEKLTDLAVQLGNIRILNVIMLGLISSFLPFQQETWLDALQHRLPAKYLDFNLNGFHTGRQLGDKYSDWQNEIILKFEE